MNDKLKALYESYKSNGVISDKTTFEQFSSANEEQLQSLYQAGVSKRAISSQTDIETFKGAWSLGKEKGAQSVAAPVAPTPLVDGKEQEMQSETSSTEQPIVSPEQQLKSLEEQKLTNIAEVERVADSMRSVIGDYKQDVEGESEWLKDREYEMKMLVSNLPKNEEGQPFFPNKKVAQDYAILEQGYNEVRDSYNKKVGSYNDIISRYGAVKEWEARNKNLVKEKELELKREAVERAKENLPLGQRAAVSVIGNVKNAWERYAKQSFAGFLSNYEEVTQEGLEFAAQIMPESVQQFIETRRKVKTQPSKEFAIKKGIEASESAAQIKEDYGLVTTLDEVDDPLSALAYASGAALEGAVQIPLAFATGGSSSFIMSSGLMYQEILEGRVRQYQEEGMTFDKAVKKAAADDDINMAALNAGAGVVAALDLAGSMSIFKGSTKKAVQDQIKKVIETRSVAQIAKKSIKGTLGEVATETLQEPIEAGTVEAAKGEKGDGFIKGFTEMATDPDAMLDIAARSAFGAGGATIVAQVSSANPDVNKIVKAVREDNEAKTFAFEYLNSQVKNGKITVEKAESIKAKIDEDVAAYQKVKSLIPEDRIDEAIPLQKEWDNLQEQAETVSGGLRSFVKNKQKEVQAKLEQLIPQTDETTEKEEGGLTDVQSEIMSDVDNLGDDEVKLYRFNSPEEAPVLLRDKLVKQEGTKGEVQRVNFLGIPIGKKKQTKAPDSYTLTVTGKELRDAKKEYEKQTEEESMLEGVRDAGDEKTEGEESTELRAKEEVEVDEIKRYGGMFSVNTTGLPSIDDVAFSDKEMKSYHKYYKDKESEVVMMSPDEYLKRVREGFGTDVDENILEGKQESIQSGIDKGDKIDMPYISYDENGKMIGQEGRNRATLAKSRGEELIPVVIQKRLSFDDKVSDAINEIADAVKSGAKDKDEVFDFIESKYGLHRDKRGFIERNVDIDEVITTNTKSETVSETEQTSGAETTQESQASAETAPVEEVTSQEVEKVAKTAGVKAKNIRGLYDVNRKMFGQNRVKSLASAVVMDRAIGQMAKRAGVPKSEMYSKIQFKKGEKAPSGALKQEAPIFKSTAQEGISKIQQKAATPEQWVKMINDKGGKGTTQELEWIGLGDYLNEWKKENNAKSVPKEVVEQYINDNQIEIVEVSKGKTIPKLVFDTDTEGRWQAEDPTGTFSGDYTIQWLRDESKFELESADGFISLHNSFEEAVDRANEHISTNQVGVIDGQTKYSQYTLEGGENYREVLLTLPQEKPASSYKSSHWDETNIVAHLRINERTLPNGERVMFIEEVQSDWAQEGKKKGFAGDSAIQKEINDLIKKEQELLNEAKKYTSKNEDAPSSITDEYTRVTNRRSFLESKDINAVPEMPYKKTDQWVGMAMRRAMQMAAQEGFDRVAWVTGEQSADRYDLSKQISQASAIKNDDGTYNLVLEDTRGDELPGYRAAGKKMTPSEMEDTIGKELAQKLIEGADRNKGREWKNQPTNPEFFTLRGDGLKVGGEGMKAFYNSILPKVTKKEAQRFDKKAKVEVVDFEQKEKDDRYKRLIERKKEFQDKADKSSGFVRDGYLEDVERTQRAIDKEYKSSKQLSIAITPEMRMNLNSAVPLFQGEQGAMLAEDGNYIIYALTNPNVSTPLHELAHVYEHYLTDAERKAIEEWSGHKSGTVEFSEAFARGFEKYLAEGKAPNSKLQKIFDRFKEWLTEIYNGIKGSEIDLELNDKMRSIYDEMLSQKSETKSRNFFESLEAGSDAALAWLEQQEKDLDKFGKETLGMNLPVAVAKVAIQAAKVAVRANKSAITAAKKAVRNTDWYKSLNDSEKLSAIDATDEFFGRKVKRNVKDETSGLSMTEQFKQGFEEYVAALRETEKAKRDEARKNAKKNIDAAKKAIRDKYTQNRDDLQAARKALKKSIEDLLKTKNIKSYSSSVLRRISAGLVNANLNNTDKILQRIESLLDYEVHKKRIKSLPNLISKAQSVVDKGRITMYQERLSNILNINPEYLPNTSKGNNLLTDLENFYYDLVNDRTISPDEAFERANNLFERYARIAETNEDAVRIYWKNKDSSKSKNETINELLDTEKITISQAEALVKMTLKSKPKEAEGKYTESQLEARSFLISSIKKNLKNINPKRQAELIDNYGEGFKKPIEAMWEALTFFDSDNFTPFMETVSTESLKKLERALAVTIPANDLSDLSDALAEVSALRKAQKLEPTLKKIGARISFTDLSGLANLLYKTVIGKFKEGLREAKIRRAQTMSVSKIDAIFGKFDGLKELYVNFIEDNAAGFSDLESMRDELLNINKKARDKILFRKAREAEMADMRMFFIASLDLFNANPNTKGVFHPQETYEAIMKELKGKSGEKGYSTWYNGMKKFTENYVTDGVVDFEKVKEALTAEELEYLKNREQVSSRLEHLGRVSRSVMRGEKFIPLQRHISHMNVLSQKGEDKSNSIIKSAEQIISGELELNMIPSTEAGSSQMREASKAPAVIPSIMKADRKSMDDILLDYNMTLPIKTARKLFNVLEGRYKEDVDEKALVNLRIIKDLVSNSMADHLLKSADMRGDFEGGAIYNHLVKAGYYHQLGDPIRAVSELYSNFSYAFFAEPKATTKGLKFIVNPLTRDRSKVNEKIYHMARVLSILKTTQAQRILGADVASVRLEPGISNQESRIKFINTIQKLSEDALRRPDTMVSQAIFFGKFALEYKKATGKEFKLETFSEEDYKMSKRSSDESTRNADDALDSAVASNNPYMGIQASTRRPNDGLFKIFDKYLTRFARNERTIMEDSIGTIIHETKKGKSADRKRISSATSNLAAATARYFSYQAAKNKMTIAAASGLSVLFGSIFGDDNDDEEERDKTDKEKVEDMALLESLYELFYEKDPKKKELLKYKINREILGYLSSMTFARVGNIQKQLYAAAINITDMYKGEGVTRPETPEEDKKDDWSEMDSYEQREGIAYSQLKKRHVEGTPILAQDMIFLTGSLSPFIRGMNDLWGNMFDYLKYDDIANDPKKSMTKRAKAEYRKKKYQERLMHQTIPSLIGASIGEAMISRTWTRLSSKVVYKDKEEEAKEMKKFVKEFRKELIKQRRKQQETELNKKLSR